MTKQRILVSVLALGLLLALAVGLSRAQGPGPQGDISVQATLGTAFTYQGQLKSGGQPVTDNCQMAFRLYDAASGGSQVGSAITTTVPITDGLFTVSLDFGSGAFTGEARWLEIAVRCPAGSGSYTTLTPRQALTPAPYALALPGLWTQQNVTSTNIIGGYSGNSVTDGVVGATIGGGGASGSTNRVTDDYGTVSGGYNNLAGNNAGTTSDADYATVGGGGSNTATADYATVGGGYSNTTSGLYATIGGGYDNTASSTGATVGGGCDNEATASHATIGGGFVNTASGGYATVGGGRSNTATADYATVGGGRYNNASGYAATVGGGRSNVVTATYATVGGGWNNNATADYATVGGGYSNEATADYATVGGGYDNEATASDATVGGGHNNTASGPGATIGGGYGNVVTATYATVGGGESNEATADYATVGGGYNNDATAGDATIGGGYNNTASGLYATVGGGYNNNASTFYATVGGGSTNTASGSYATVPGGYGNTAQGAYSFAAGRRAQALHDGAIILADSNNFDFASTVPNSFKVRATGGIRFVLGIDDSGNMTWSCLVTNGTSWSCTSDRNQKENLRPVDGFDILQRLNDVPIFTWNGRRQDPSIRHMGPMAQDFYAAFGLGEDDTHIATIDLDGVALAAIQGLYALSQEQATRIEALEAENTSLQRQVDELEARVAALEQSTTHPTRMDLLPGMGVLLVGLGLVWMGRRKGGPR